MVWVVVIGLVMSFQSYSSRRALSWSVDEEVPAQRSERHYTLELTTSFSPSADVFALTAGVEFPDKPVRVSVAGREIPFDHTLLRPGEPVAVELENIVEPGWNEILVQAVPERMAQPRSQAVRAAVYSNGGLLAQDSFWSVPDGKVSGVLRFEIKKEVEHAGH